MRPPHSSSSSVAVAAAWQQHSCTRRARLACAAATRSSVSILVPPHARTHANVNHNVICSARMQDTSHARNPLLCLPRSQLRRLLCLVRLRRGPLRAVCHRRLPARRHRPHQTRMGAAACSTDLLISSCRAAYDISSCTEPPTRAHYLPLGSAVAQGRVRACAPPRACGYSREPT
jgi:hypothetical protein